MAKGQNTAVKSTSRRSGYVGAYIGDDNEKKLKSIAERETRRKGYRITVTDVLARFVREGLSQYESGSLQI